MAFVVTETTPIEEAGADPELERIVAEEEACLARVLEHLASQGQQRPSDPGIDYDSQLLSLRDQIASARLEDVPPLVEQMERLQMLAARKRETTTGYVDPRSPYFGRLLLEENGRQREVLIGRSTYLDTDAGVRIVDWREAPVSRLYYRYDEGDDYIETFGEREVEGEVRKRRSLAIVEGELRRITAPEGTFIRGRKGWKRAGAGATLSGGQGTATRAAQHHEPGKLGVGLDEISGEDKHLKEITSLIDKRQFELITRPDSGLVVVQGGAGSGKTTIGLHRMAYLAYQDSRRFRPDRMVVIVFNEALARYVSYVLPALGVAGVGVRTYQDWAARLRQLHVAGITKRYTEDTPAVVTRMKKHPTMLRAIDAHVARLAAELEAELEEAVTLEDAGEEGEALLQTWRKSGPRPLAHRLFAVDAELKRRAKKLPGAVRTRCQSVLASGQKTAADTVGAWADLLSDLDALKRTFGDAGLSNREIERAHSWCTTRCLRVIDELEELLESGGHRKTPKEEEGIDGEDAREPATLDYEDDTLLLRFVQRMRGPLFRGKGKKEPLVYEHVLIDEAQDLSPVELSVITETVSKADSITMAGDTAQRLHMDNGFSDWKTVLADLGKEHVEVEPLEISYRSTEEIIDFSRHVLGPLAPASPPKAIRRGAPVELMQFTHSGDAVGFLGEALRILMKDEPLASVAVIARYPEQADIYADGLVKAEVAHVRRITDQDFPFKPGIDVTDVRQVKGLEFDYVILVEVSKAAYPEEEDARHLLHIAATRAAHQLWITTTGAPSDLVPERLREAGY